MSSRCLCLTFSLAVWAGCVFPSLAADKQGCPITKPSDRFVPPPPYELNVGSREFLYGTPTLWTVIYPDWHIHSGGKLPFFRQGYDATKERNPRLTVVAGRLDGNAALVWNTWANSASSMAGMFMTTGIDIAASGCREIAAHYVASPDNIKTLSCIAWVEP